MFAFFAVLFALAWILTFGILHIASSAIHLLLVVAVISLVWHFIAARRPVA